MEYGEWPPHIRSTDIPRPYTVTDAHQQGKSPIPLPSEDVLLEMTEGGHDRVDAEELTQLMFDGANLLSIGSGCGVHDGRMITRSRRYDRHLAGNQGM